MSQLTIQEIATVDTYNVYNCMGCGHEYQLPVRQWKGQEEEVLPAMNCMHCGIYCYHKVKSLSALQVRESYMSIWMDSPSRMRSIPASLVVLSAAAFSAAQMVLPHFVR